MRIVLKRDSNSCNFSVRREEWQWLQTLESLKVSWFTRRGVWCQYIEDIRVHGGEKISILCSSGKNNISRVSEANE